MFAFSNPSNGNTGFGLDVQCDRCASAIHVEGKKLAARCTYQIRSEAMQRRCQCLAASLGAKETTALITASEAED